MVKGVGGEGRGDLGVRFDRLNELRVGKVPELVGALSPVGEPVEPCRRVSQRMRDPLVYSPLWQRLSDS